MWLCVARVEMCVARPSTLNLFSLLFIIYSHITSHCTHTHTHSSSLISVSYRCCCCLFYWHFSRFHSINWHKHLSKHLEHPNDPKELQTLIANDTRMGGGRGKKGRGRRVNECMAQGKGKTHTRRTLWHFHFYFLRSGA